MRTMVVSSVSIDIFIGFEVSSMMGAWMVRF